MTNIARLFSWDDIGQELLTVVGNRTGQINDYGDCGDSEAELLLLVVCGLDDGITEQALIDAAIAKKDYVLRSREAVEVLWNAVRSGDKQTFDMVTTEIQKRKPQELGHFVEVFSRYIKDYRESSEQFGEASEQFGVLKTITEKRMEWLKGEIE
ncbi:hypothetical protein PI126_g24449 [Phytophthora idaei]|nr:hypothetical protein PI126_g24449 [Phytophthora idaei]